MSLAWGRPSLRSPGRESNPGRQASEACVWCRRNQGNEHVGERSRAFSRMNEPPCEESNLVDRVRSTVPGPPGQGEGRRGESAPAFKTLVGSAAGARASGKASRPACRPGVPSGSRTRVPGLRVRLPWPSSRWGRSRCDGRGGRIRTGDLLFPEQALLPG
jgi:hypothetical protein